MAIFRLLLKPIKIGKLLLYNRIAMAPIAIGGLINPDGTLTQRAIDFYVERAKGGVSLIIMGATKVENEIERILLDGAIPRPLITSRASSSLSELADLIHHYGSKLFIQLTAGYGRAISGGAIDKGVKPVSASATPVIYRPHVTAKPLSTEEVENLVAAFGQAAEIVAAAEIDGIELHGHQGYLFDQFTTAIWNKRNDKYGGNLEDRLRFPIEVIQTIRDRVGKDFPIIYRFGLKHYMRDAWTGTIRSDGYMEAGRDIREGLEMAKLLEKAGVNALHVDAGCHESLYWPHPPPYMPHGCMIDMAAEVKKNVKIPVIAVGKLDIPELAEKVLEQGKADIVAIGRGLLADPYWPRKVFEGRLDDIRPCIKCNTCIARITIGSVMKPLCCAVNPSVGRERLFELKPAEKPKKILIAGGGVAGMEAARVASIRGHKVILYERNAYLGGHLVAASVPPFKEDIRRLLKWYENQLEKVGVNVILNCEVTLSTIEDENPDIVIVATGSRPIVPKLKGIEKTFVATCIDLLLGTKTVGNTVVVWGGGLIGCETALWLAQQGKKVSIVTRGSNPLMTGTPLFRANRMMLLELLALNKVEIITNSTICEITDQGVIVLDKNLERMEINCETVALSRGLEPEDHLYRSLRGKIPQLYIIGDCRVPKDIRNAVWDAWTIASTV